MKKIIATLIAVMVLVASFATVTAFAAESPSAKPTYKIEVVSYSDGEAEKGTYTSLEDGNIKVEKAKDSEEEFTGWVISVANADGSLVAAVEGVDYKIISGSMASGTLVIMPLNNLVIEESYNVKGSAGEGKPAVDGNDSTQSPQTGSRALASLAVVAMLSMAGAVAVKKVKA